MSDARQELSRPSRAVICVGGERTRLEQRNVPMPGRGEVLLALRAVGLCGTDLFKLSTHGARPGSVLGHELVGSVVASGADVQGLEPGDRVAVPHHVPCGECARCRSSNETLCETFRENLMYPGGFSDLILIRERAVRHAARKLPEHLCDDVAVWMEPAACVLRAIERSGIDAGGPSRIAAVLGAGGMGALHLLLLKALDPGIRVVMVDPDPSRRRLVSSLGADRAVAPEQAAPSVRAMSDGAGADTVFDTVGGAGVLDSALEVSREGATVLLFAHAAQGEQARFDINTLFKFERRIIGSYSGTPAEQQRVFELMIDGRLDPSPLVTHRLDLSRFSEGVALVKRREAMKVVFTGRIPVR